jgi:hypothetical protein
VKHDTLDSTGFEQSMNFIPESDVYRLIIKSKLPEAEKFEEWVMDEVLPQLRQCGVYITESATQEAIDYQSLYGKNRVYNTFINTVDLEAEYKRFYDMSKAERKARHINNDIRIECSKIIQKAITDRIANSLTEVPASKLLAMRELSEQIQVDITKLSNKANGGFKANMTKKIRTQQQQLEFMETELIEVRSQYNELEHEYEEYRNIQEQGEDAELIEIEYFGFSNNDMYDYIDGKVRRTYKYNSWINRFPVHTIDTLSEDVDFDKDYTATDFDLTSLEDEFDGDYQKQFDYLVAHKDDKITLKQEEDMEFNDISAEFEVAGILFTPVSTDVFKK